MSAKKSARTQPRGAPRVTTDSFINPIARLGKGQPNLSSYDSYDLNAITRERLILDYMYRGSWVIGVGIDAVADDMTREGVDFTGTSAPDELDALDAGIVDLAIWESIGEAIKWGRLYGGAIAVMLIDGQDMTKPLDAETIRPGQFKGLYVFDRWMLAPSWDAVVADFGPELGKPLWYEPAPIAPLLRGVKIHHTRCLRFVGVPLPYYQRVAEWGWGMSIVERVFDRLTAFDSTTVGAAQLVHKSYVRTLKIDGLRKIIAAGGPALDALTKNLDMIRMLQSAEGLTVLDGQDDFHGLQYAFPGLSDLILQFGQQIAGAFQVPLVRFFGTSPAGMNATGESDFRQYYDGIGKEQERHRSQMGRLFDVLYRSLIGRPPSPSFGFTFRPLWKISRGEKADIAERKTRTVLAAFDGGVVGRQTALKELRQQADETGVWSNITDDEISAADDEPPPPQAEGGEGGEGSLTGEEGERSAGFGVGDDFNPSEPRDPDGKWTSGAAGAKASHVPAERNLKGALVGVGGASLPSHIAKLRVPPAWTDVTYSTDPKSALWVSGKDAKGRPQAIYSPEHIDRQAKIKFARIQELDRKFDQVFDQNEAARKSEDSRQRAAADCLALIMGMGIRPGSEDDTGAEKKAYGATTLEGRHVVIGEGGGVSLQFVGKKGVSLNLPVPPALAKMLIERKRAAGEGGQLFAINEKALLDHTHSLDGGGFKTKDFRTRLGTQTAVSAISEMTPPKNEAAYKKMVREVAVAVAKKLGNTPAIALQSYINPAVFAGWRAAI